MYSELHALTSDDKKAIHRLIQEKDFRSVEKLIQWKIDVVVDSIMLEADERKSYALKCAVVILKEITGHLRQVWKEVNDKKEDTVTKGVEQEATRIFGPKNEGTKPTAA